MSIRFLFNISWCALLSVTLSGCYSHHQYPYGGTYPGPYGSPGPYQMAPGTMGPATYPPGSYPVQPDLGQPVPPPQGSLPSSSPQTYGDGFPNNTNNTNYDGVDTQWKQPLNNAPSASNTSPFDANPTASGTNSNLGSGLNSSPSAKQVVPSYQDPNQPPANQFPENSKTVPETPQSLFPGNSKDEFETNKTPQPLGGNTTQMQDQFSPSGNDQFESNPKNQFQNNPNDQFQSNPTDQFQKNENEGFSVPQPAQPPVQQQSFESGSDTFDANPKKFDANRNDTFNANPVDSSQEFQPPVKSFPENDGSETFGPNSSSFMNPASGKVSHANHQSRTSGPQLVKSDQFMPPAEFQAASFELPAGSGNQNSAAKTPSPFNYDKQQYRWLRGIVEFDEQEKSWNITYNATPDKADKFGGNIVLIDQGKLTRFKNGDVVLIDGQIDGSQQDKMGKPCYRITKAQRLLPKK
ncbi:hypothetical protein [uncultured Gimesia sp.]|jgi:hypothetical protein|uniref:hypothetical protein n=1 Tax=uncultured Gimesia sp. TaxID=1678688 RepID=UPI00262B297C|nr:hypothetical protein [uncultured Gimesia sp.]